MSDRFCEICTEFNSGDNYCLELNDDKTKEIILGHKQCIDELHIKITTMKDYKKMNNQKILKQVGFTRQ